MIMVSVPADESRKCPDGESAEPGLKAATSSGFWLGFEGIVGMEAGSVEGITPPEDGKSGEISGEILVDGETGTVLGSNAGAAGIVSSLS